MARKSPVLTKLAALELAIKVAREEHEQADLAFNQAKRNVARATGEVRDYLASVARRGEEPNRKTLDTLLQAKTEAEANCTSRPVLSQGREISTEMIDLRAEARRDAAADALTEAEDNRWRYIRENRQAIGEARTPEALEARDELFAAWATFQAKVARWSQVRNSWEPMLGQWGMTPHDLPVNVIARASGDMAQAFSPIALGNPGETRDARDFIPMPRSLAPRQEPAGPEPEDGVVTQPILTRPTP